MKWSLSLISVLAESFQAFGAGLGISARVCSKSWRHSVDCWADDCCVDDGDDNVTCALPGMHISRHTMYLTSALIAGVELAAELAEGSMGVTCNGVISRT